ncbi:MAG: hypothetical protein U0575_02680 [Phycisphaerales bacterium]
MHRFPVSFAAAAVVVAVATPMAKGQDSPKVPPPVAPPARPSPTQPAAPATDDSAVSVRAVSENPEGTLVIELNASGRDGRLLVVFAAPDDPARRLITKVVATEGMKRVEVKRSSPGPVAVFGSAAFGRVGNATIFNGTAAPAAVRAFQSALAPLVNDRGLFEIDPKKLPGPIEGSCRSSPVGGAAPRTPSSRQTIIGSVLCADGPRNCVELLIDADGVATPREPCPDCIGVLPSICYLTGGVPIEFGTTVSGLECTAAVGDPIIVTFSFDIEPPSGSPATPFVWVNYLDASPSPEAYSQSLTSIISLGDGLHRGEVNHRLHAGRVEVSGMTAPSGPKPGSKKVGNMASCGDATSVGAARQPTSKSSAGAGDGAKGGAAGATQRSQDLPPFGGVPIELFSVSGIGSDRTMVFFKFTNKADVNAAKVWVLDHTAPKPDRTPVLLEGVSRVDDNGTQDPSDDVYSGFVPTKRGGAEFSIYGTQNGNSPYLSNVRSTR